MRNWKKFKRNNCYKNIKFWIINKENKKLQPCENNVKNATVIKNGCQLNVCHALSQISAVGQEKENANPELNLKNTNEYELKENKGKDYKLITKTK